jgi:NAD(P)-dependent dehydrogenase (short-subunit alcohol dehydrogenase family)
MKKKIIVIAGGLGLIGSSLAKILSKKYFIVVLDKKNSKDKEKYFNVNINNFNELNNFVKNFKYKIHVAINATYQTLKKKNDHFLSNQLNKTSIDYIERHLVSYYNFTKIFFDYFYKNNTIGKIINFSSIYGTFAPNFKIYVDTKVKSPIEYSISKAGVIIMTKFFSNWAKFKKKKIYINSISPAGVVSENTSSSFRNNYKKYYLSSMVSLDSINKVIISLLDKKNKKNGKNIIIKNNIKII